MARCAHAAFGRLHLTDYDFLLCDAYGQCGYLAAEQTYVCDKSARHNDVSDAIRKAGCMVRSTG